MIRSVFDCESTHRTFAVDGPISLEIVGTATQGKLSEARELARIRANMSAPPEDGLSRLRQSVAVCARSPGVVSRYFSF